MLMEAILVGLVGMLGQLDSKLFGEARLSQPLVMGALAGLACGDLGAGIVLGAQFQLIWMGIMGIGATPSMDVATGSAMGTAFAILNGAGIEVAMALALPIALLLQYANVLVRATITPPLMHIGDKYALEANSRMIGVLHWTGILTFGILLGFIPCFLGILLGANAVEVFVNAIPEFIMNGLNGISKVFPAFGFALLLNVTLDSALVPFFIVGFVLAAYLGMNTLAIALIATAFALVMFQLKRSSTGVQNEEDEL